MPIRNQNWYDLQATRRYPLDDSSTGVDDAGAFIRDSVLVDCHIRFPDTLGLYAYIQGITVAPALVTIVFGVGNHPQDTNGPSIAALSLPRTAAQNVNHELTALQPGVAGWAVLGAGITEEFAGRYTTPQQTLISKRCARPYRPLPVTSVGKLNIATSLQDVVTVAAQPPVTATAETVIVDGEEVNAIVFRLEGELQTFNPLEFYQGPCGQRPESGTCPKPAIETINGISPDCAGNINIVFDGFDAYPYLNCGGVDVISNTGLAEACDSGALKSRRVVQDKCYPSQSLADGDDPTWDPPLPPTTPPIIISSESLPDEGWPETCATLPACRDFGAGSADDFVTKTGLFVFVARNAPGVCGADDVPGDSALILSTHFTYTAANIVGHNVALFKNCASDWALGKTIHAELRLSGNGLLRNGGIVFNYVRGNPGLRIPTTYMVAQLNASNNKVELQRWNGSRFVTEYSADFPVVVSAWHRLSVRPTLAGNTVIVAVSAAAMDDSVTPLSFTVPIPLATFGDPVGQAGLFSDRAYTHFNKFKIEAYV
jgi:hypothetical protein